MLPLLPTEVSQAYESALDIPFNTICEQYANILQQQLTFARLCPAEQQELWLRRLLESARPLSRKFGARAERLRQDPYRFSKKLAKIYGDILLALTHTCDEAGNSDAADRFILELASLPNFVQPLEDAPMLMQRLRSAFQNQSVSLDRKWRDLDLKKHLDLAQASTHNLFCYEHLILLSGMPTATAQSVLKYEADSGRHDRLKRTDMHIAVEAADPDLVRLVYEQNKQSLEAIDIFHMTPMLLAALVGNFDVFKMLYKFGANPKALDRFSRDVFVIACEMGHDDIVNFLLGKGAKPNEGYNDPQYSPLFAAAGRGRLSTVTLLLSKGANPSQVSIRQTPREVAELNGHHEICKLLDKAEAKSKTAADSHSLSDHPYDVGVPTWARTHVLSSRGSSLQGVLRPLPGVHTTPDGWPRRPPLRPPSPLNVAMSPVLEKMPIFTYQETSGITIQSPAAGIAAHHHSSGHSHISSMDTIGIPEAFELTSDQSKSLQPVSQEDLPNRDEAYGDPNPFEEFSVLGATSILPSVLQLYPLQFPKVL